MDSNLSVIVQYIVDKFEANKTALGVKDVFYGDQNRIPNIPSITVEGGDKDRSYTQTGLQTVVNLPVFIYIYHSGIRDLQITKKACDELAEAVEALLHTDVNLGGLVVNGLVTSMEPGFANRGKEIFVVHRLTWQGIAKVRIGV